MSARGNLFADLPDALPREVFEPLLGGSGPWRLERIVSTGQATPPGEWYDQPRDEWVVLLRGAAAVRFDGDAEAVRLEPGDWLHLPARRRHRVDWTAAGEVTVWLALHGDADGGEDE